MRWGLKMKFGVWYGAAIWFLIFKSLNFDFIQNVSWLVFLLLIIIPNISENQVPRHNYRNKNILRQQTTEITQKNIKI